MSRCADEPRSSAAPPAPLLRLSIVAWFARPSWHNRCAAMTAKIAVRASNLRLGARWHAHGTPQLIGHDHRGHATESYANILTCEPMKSGMRCVCVASAPLAARGQDADEQLDVYTLACLCIVKLGRLPE